MKYFFLIIFLMPVYFFAKQGKDYVVCIHGFMGNSWQMRPMENELKKDGWKTINWKYPSRDYLIQEHGERLVKELQFLARNDPDRPIHFVTHSMGGLVLLAALNHPDCPNEAKKGKLILIAPPMRGSHFARWFSRFSFAKSVMKNRSGKELMTKFDFRDYGEFPSSLEGVLIIVGNSGWNFLLSGRNDGTITVAESNIDYPHETKIIFAKHLTIMTHRKTFFHTINHLNAKLWANCS